MVVIGGGVVGISCALALRADGHEVTVLEPGPVGEGASWASCGCIAVGEVVPLSQPGILLKAPGWLLNPEGPLAIRPATAAQMLPWLLRFAANARPARMRAIAADLARLTFMATADFKAQIADIGRPDLLVERPVIKLFDGEADREEMRAPFALARKMGCTIDEISGAEAREMEPAIAADFRYAALLRDWSHVADPVLLVRELHRAFAARGGVVRPVAGTGFTREGARVTGVKTGAGEVEPADEVVIAAGARSKPLAAALGVKLRLEGVIGYSTLLREAGVDLRHTLFYPAGGFGVTPYDGALAVAGTAEFAGPDAAPRWSRADILVKRARRVLPELATGKAERRMGRRPFTPDTRPVIGRPDGLGDVVMATGHGQLGVTLAATTGRMVADIVAGRPASCDLAPYGPDRFR
ncbi:MAG: NAD(P)/FAD-dependent oxidoreductase [Pikeienuella sp.]